MHIHVCMYIANNVGAEKSPLRAASLELDIVVAMWFPIPAKDGLFLN